MIGQPMLALHNKPYSVNYRPAPALDFTKIHPYVLGKSLLQANNNLNVTNLASHVD